MSLFFFNIDSPTWTNNIDGQSNLRDAVNGLIKYTSPEGKVYELNANTATLFVRYLIELYLPPLPLLLSFVSTTINPSPSSSPSNSDLAVGT